MEAVGSKIESGVSFITSEGRRVQGTLLHLNGETIVFELYNPDPVVRRGETLQSLTVHRAGRPIYSGSAAVFATLATGPLTLITATILGTWSERNGLVGGGRFCDEVRELVGRWGAGGPISPAYQVAVTDIRSFLTDLNRWLAPLDVAGGSDSPYPSMLLDSVAEELFEVVHPRLKELFNKFEAAAREIAPEDRAAHRIFAQRELHPLILCAPLVHRTFTKPLGYAGDYEMVNMILRNRMEGPSLYARIVNAYFLRMDIAEGHRNRIGRLVDTLREEVRRLAPTGRPLRVLNLGCGPAVEVCQFLAGDPLSERCDFTLLDFNEETLSHTRAQIRKAMDESGRCPEVEYVNRSVLDLLKQASRTNDTTVDRYDLIYCAGLFDYLSDRACSRLLHLMYRWVRPGGVLLATNVHPRHSAHATLEDLDEWHLILRTEADMLALHAADDGAPVVDTEAAGVNVFLKTRKPESAIVDRFATERYHAAG